MNKEFLINLVSTHLDLNNTISENKFNEVFATFNGTQKSDVRLCLKEYGIAIVTEPLVLKYEETSENKQQSTKSAKIIKTSEYITQKNLRGLTNEQLCVLYQKGNELALSSLMQNNEKLVWSRVRKYSGRYRHKLDLEDLLAFGNMGMMKAADRYDVTYESRFTTYAIHWIDQAILRSIADFGFTIRIPVHVFEDVNRLARVEREGAGKSKEEFYLMLQEKGITPKKYEQLKVISRDILTVASLNSIVGDTDETELGEFIINDEQMTVEAQVERSCLKDSIDLILEDLTSREREIIQLRFGLGDGIPKTLEQVGKIYGVTRERIRQIEAKALKKLKSPCRVRKIQAYSVR